MSRLIEIVGHLHRQSTARRELLDQPRQQQLMMGNPLQNGVRQNHIERTRIVPRLQILDDKAHVWQSAPRCLDHVARAIDTGNICLRIAGRQHFGGISGTAAQIDDRMGIDRRQRREQIAHGPGAFILEGNVLFSGPTQFKPANQVITMLSREMRRSEKPWSVSRCAAVTRVPPLALIAATSESVCDASVSFEVIASTGICANPAAVPVTTNSLACAVSSSTMLSAVTSARVSISSAIAATALARGLAPTSPMSAIEMRMAPLKA